MADMGQEVAELRRRVMALEADPHAAAAANAGKQIFMDALARVGERVQKLEEVAERTAADIQRLLAQLNSLSDTASELVVRMAAAEGRHADLADTAEQSYHALSARVASVEQSLATAAPVSGLPSGADLDASAADEAAKDATAAGGAKE